MKINWKTSHTIPNFWLRYKSPINYLAWFEYKVA